MDIDLDAFFGGQGATDLDDYDDDYEHEAVETTTAPPQGAIDLDGFFGGQSATDLDDDDDDDDDIDTTSPQSVQTIGHPLSYELFSRMMRDSIDADFTINAPGYEPPKHSQWKRDDAGKLVIWDDIKVARPVYRRSPLHQVEGTALEEPMPTPVDTTTDSSSSSSSSSSSDTDTPPSSPESAWPPIEACPRLSLLPPPIDTTSPSLEDSATKSSERGSAMYAAIIISISVVLSLW
ncbi:MAG: hypothetical protein Q9168_002899 [Polycauliona sp. 1 TL-2023]